MGIEEVALIPSKPLRNKIAGFITHLMKRLQRSTVRGISIKLQEEERERRDNYVPDVSAQTSAIKAEDHSRACRGNPTTTSTGRQSSRHVSAVFVRRRISMSFGGFHSRTSMVVGPGSRVALFHVPM